MQQCASVLFRLFRGCYRELGVSDPLVEGGSFNKKMAPESRLAADEILVANQTVAAETVNAAAAPPPVRRGPPLRTNVMSLSSDHSLRMLTPCCRRRPARSPPARYTARGTRAYALVLWRRHRPPRDACRPHAAQGEMPGSQKKKVTKVERELWLSATIQDCKVVTTQETARAKCFLKIHWQDNAFPEKIRDEKLLPDEAASREDLKLEKMAVDLEKGGMVYGISRFF